MKKNLFIKIISIALVCIFENEFTFVSRYLKSSNASSNALLKSCGFIKENWKQISVFSFYISTEATSCIMHCIGNLIRKKKFWILSEFNFRLLYENVFLFGCIIIERNMLRNEYVWILKCEYFLTNSVFVAVVDEPKGIFVVCTNGSNWRKHF